MKKYLIIIVLIFISHTICFSQTPKTNYKDVSITLGGPKMINLIEQVGWLMELKHPQYSYSNFTKVTYTNSGYSIEMNFEDRDGINYKIVKMKVNILEDKKKNTKPLITDYKIISKSKLKSGYKYGGYSKRNPLKSWIKNDASNIVNLMKQKNSNATLKEVLCAYTQPTRFRINYRLLLLLSDDSLYHVDAHSLKNSKNLEQINIDKENLIVLRFKSDLNKSNKMGGFTEQNPYNPSILVVARLGIRLIQKKESSWKEIQIHRARTQVVSGLNYQFVYEFQTLSGNIFVKADLYKSFSSKNPTLQKYYKVQDAQGNPIKEIIVGGVTKQSKHSEKAKNYVDIFLPVIAPGFHLVQIIEVKTQVVNGLKYIIKIEIKKDNETRIIQLNIVLNTTGHIRHFWHNRVK